MTANELRRKYIEFFIAHNHREVSGKSLIPENDPTVLFTTAGMHHLVPYILGEPHPSGVSLRPCDRESPKWDCRVVERQEIPARPRGHEP